MAKRIVNDYQAGWNPNKKIGGIRVKIEPSTKYVKLKLKDNQEFFAMLMLLQGRKGVYYDDKAKVFATTLN